MPNYFLLALSNRTNLDLCLRYSLAGFTNSGSGFWTFLEINQGDYVSFLYGAKAWNLYQVDRKSALKDADKLPPWPPVTFQPSGRTYYFPFRLHLKPVRAFQESLVRTEFAYVAENLLLRGGYRKTHFQADQTTLQNVSIMGEPFRGEVEYLQVDPVHSYEPLIGFTKESIDHPAVYGFSELILQALIKRYLRAQGKMRDFLYEISMNSLAQQSVEILGELGLPEGQIDALIQETTPIGVAERVAIEVKLRSASIADLEQLGHYVRTLGSECKGGVLIAERASRKTLSYAKEKGLRVFRYSLNLQPNSQPLSFEQLFSGFQLTQATI